MTIITKGFGFVEVTEEVPIWDMTVTEINVAAVEENLNFTLADDTINLALEESHMNFELVEEVIDNVLGDEEVNVQFDSQILIDSGTGGGDITQSTHLNVAQNDEIIITHATDVEGERIAQVAQNPALLGLSNTSLDFDLADESDFVQEDAVNGTDFVDGVLRLHNAGSGIGLGFASYVGAKVLDPPDQYPQGMFWKPDGTKFYIGCSTTDAIHQWSCATPWDPTSASYESLLTTAPVNNIKALSISPDGTTLLFVENNVLMRKFTLSTPWDISSAGDDTDTYDFTVKCSAVGTGGIFVKPDGTKLYVTCNANNEIYQFTFDTPWSPSTLTDDLKKIITTGVDNGPVAIAINSTGKTLYLLGTGNESVFDYSISSAWDISTASYQNSSFLFSDKTTVPTGIFLSASEDTIFITEVGTDSMLVYSIGEYLYPTAQAYYATTSDLNQIDMTNFIQLNTVTFTTDTPVGTSVGLLVSFDGRTTWRAASLNPHSGPTNKSGWASVTEMQTALASLDTSSLDSLDFAFLLSTTDASVTPSFDQITLNYDENGTYKICYDEYIIDFINDTQTKLTKTSAGVHNSIKVNILL